MADENLIELVNRLLSLEDLRLKNEAFGEKLHYENQNLRVEIRLVMDKIRKEIKND